MILLLDIGNTCIKWAQLLEGRLTPQQSLVHRDVQPEQWMKELFRERFRPARFFVSNVAGPQMRERLVQEAQRLWQVTPEFAATASYAAGVTHAYRDVSAHGIDRWLAVIAAYKLAKGAACVVDAGTAVTIDAVDAKGLHLGGLIIPGMRMMIDSLLKNTGDIAQQARKLSGTARADVSGKQTLLATGTAHAVASGALLAIASAADRAVAQIGEQIGSAPKVILTGGDAQQVQRAMHTQVVVIPDLVLQGLAIFAGHSPES